jgi:hypothetical protein
MTLLTSATLLSWLLLSYLLFAAPGAHACANGYAIKPPAVRNEKRSPPAISQFPNQNPRVMKQVIVFRDTLSSLHIANHLSVIHLICAEPFL